MLLGEEDAGDSEVTVYPNDERESTFTVGHESFAGENTIGSERIARIRLATFQHFATPFSKKAQSMPRMEQNAEMFH